MWVILIFMVIYRVFRPGNYRKIPKYLDTQEIDVIILNLNDVALP